MARSLLCSKVRPEHREHPGLCWVSGGDGLDLAKPGPRSVCAGLWQGAKVAIKFVVSDSLNSNSVTLRESLLGQLLSHPNVSSLR